MKSFVYLRVLRAFVVEIWMVPHARTSAGSNWFGVGYAASIRIKRLI
jgi:hypothetical protein